MITINMAIIVQMLNFLVAYIIIRILLLKPVMKVIVQEETQAAANQGIINDFKQANDAKADTLQRRWAHCQQECLAIAPCCPVEQNNSLIKGQAIAHDMPTINPQDKDQLVNDLTRELVKRMSHVR